MKKLLLALSFVATTLQAQTFESATEAVSNMRIGWNLGNTLDSNSGSVDNMWIEQWTQRRPQDYETAWGQPVTKPELMALMKNAGFNAIRVPVTWYPHMEAKFDSFPWDMQSDDFGTQIQAAWMQRVHEVVDYVINQGMYCILNVHHDTGDASTAWLRADMEVYNKEKARFEEIWRQIAEEFKDYDHHLLFEGYNEMLDSYGSWCFASFATSSNYNASVASSAYQAINSYAQSFVNAVRSTGGNNAQRNLIVNTYGACCGSGTWNSHLTDPLTQMVLPTDDASNHLLFEVHSYLDVKNLNTAKSDVNQMLTALQTHLASKGAPIIFGEWGTSTENGYANYRQNMLSFARYFVEQAKAKGFATFYWMGLSDGSHRSVPEFNEPDLVDAIVKGYYGDQGYTAITPLTRSTTTLPHPLYDLQGCQVSRPSRGLYVTHGKKFVVKE